MLLKFYRVTLTHMLKQSSQLVIIITKYLPLPITKNSLEKYSMRQFHLLMAEKPHTVTFTLDEDLGAPVFFLDAISDLRIILSAYESSLAPISNDDQEISAIIESSLTPYLRQCEQMAKSLPELSRNIMLSNCYDLAKVSWF
jgi:Conserved oligomeric complex COG6